MATISDYKIVTRKGEESLQREVKAHLATGWQLQGGVSIAFSPPDETGHGSIWFSQAMILTSIAP